MRPLRGAEVTVGKRVHRRDAAGEGADAVLRALAEPRRRAILQLVAHDELAAGQIASAVEITRTAVSQHLTVLKNAGLLHARGEAPRRLYRARSEGLVRLRDVLEDIWASSLDVARELVEADRRVTGTEHEQTAAG